MKAVIACLFAMLLISLQGLSTGNVLAASGWMGDLLVDFDVTYKTYTYRDYCYADYQHIQLSDGSWEKGCVFGSGDGVQIVNYKDFFDVSLYAVSFPSSPVFYPLKVCENVWGCAYSPSEDSFVEVGVGRVSLHRNVTKVLKRASSDLFKSEFSLSSSPQTIYNAFDQDGPPKISLSKNGRWAGLHVAKEGYFMIDVAKGIARQVAQSDHGTSVRQQIAPSSDGRYLAIFIAYDDLSIVDTLDCPQETMTCRRSYSPATSLPSGLWNVSQLRFTPEDKWLLTEVDVLWSMPRLMALTTQTTTGNRPTYIALGDSFSSGEGETDDSFYQPGTNVSAEKCHLSLRSYPYLLARMWDMRAASVACSGAVTGDILGGPSYLGQGGRLGRAGLRLDATQITAATIQSLVEMIPGRRPQLDFISYYKPAFVTVGIGGNDAGLMAKLKACLMPGTCEAAKPGDKRRQTIKELQAILPKYINVLTAIKEASPSGSVVAIGYPLPSSPINNCSWLIDTLLDREERRYLNETIRYLNQIMEQAASLTHTHFVDSSELFRSNGLCSGVGTPTMNDIRLGDDIAVGLPFLKLIGTESFHPTPYGHTLMAESIAKQLGGIPAKSLGDPLEARPYEILHPKLAPYWGATDNLSNLPQLLHVDFLSSVEALPHQSLGVSVGSGTFMPETAVDIWINSEPELIQKVFSDKNGAVATTINVPSVESGAHSIVLKGVSPAGEPIELYSGLTVQGLDENLAADESYLPENISSRPNINKLYSTGVLGRQIPEDIFENKPLQQPKVDYLGYVLPLIALILTIWLYRYGQRTGIMSRMNIRKVVKKLIPTRLFRAIEPVGHLLEAVIANIRYGFPGRRLRVIGVTGTNGKTTTSFMIHRMLHEAGLDVALSTTVGYGFGSEITSQTEHITTAQAGVLQRRLKQFADAGVEWVVVETSSHSLAQHRVWGVPYEIAVMTNVTHDHLDYHRTFERYVNAKRRLFKIANRHGRRFGVINADDPSAAKFKKAIKRTATYGIKAGDLRAKDMKLEGDHSTFEAHIKDDSYKIKVNIPGEFNVSNAMAAVLVGREIGLSRAQIEKGIAALKGVEGRMTVIDEGQPFKVIVDFASTPDGFQKFFESMRPLVKGKLIAVFGSAGRRDAKKRAVQGKIAGKYADIVIATEEDDRDEDGQMILEQIAKGARKSGKQIGKNLILEPNRENAIAVAMTLATSSKDAVVLLGKGHEKTIERADGEHPWSDPEVARTALRAMLKSQKK